MSSRNSIDNLLVLQLIKKFPAIKETLRFIDVFTILPRPCVTLSNTTLCFTVSVRNPPEHTFQLKDHPLSAIHD